MSLCPATFSLQSSCVSSVPFNSSAVRGDQTSFPTRRSSDLNETCGFVCASQHFEPWARSRSSASRATRVLSAPTFRDRRRVRSEEHTSELQSLTNLVCRLLLEKKKLHCQRGEEPNQLYQMVL